MMMRKKTLPLLLKPAVLFCLSAGLYVANVEAQSLAGITNKADTSFTTSSAYTYAKKDNPQIKIISEFNYGDVQVVKNFSYCTIGQRHLAIEAFIPKQASTTKRIAVIMIHGGGWRSGNRMQHWPLAESLAHLGYVCFTPEYRLSTEALFPAAVYDLKASIRWVKANAAKYNIDTAKVVIAGYSAGGELAAFMGTTGSLPMFEGNEGNNGISTHVNAIVDIDGTLSFVHPDGREGNDSVRTSAATYWFGYPKKDKLALWVAASPLSYVDRYTPPTLFINSSLPYMHAGRSDYINILSDYGIYTEVHGFDEAPHTFPLFDPWFQPMVGYIDGFLKKVFLK